MKRLLSLFSLSVLLSCSISGVLENQSFVSLPGEYDDIMVSTDNLFLFADLKGNDCYKTKSGDRDAEMVSLESLLDREASEQIAFKSLIVKQIPFLDNRNEKKVMFSMTRHDRYDEDSTTFVKTFLIETSDTLNGSVIKTVATMIPNVSYINMYGASSVSFLEKSTYRGIILFSDLYGNLHDIYTYGDGPIGDAQFIPLEEDEAYSGKRYLSIPTTVNTKSDSEDSFSKELEASYCIAERSLKPPSKWYPDNWDDYDGHDEFDDLRPIESGGGGGPPHPYEPVKYRISLHTTSGGQVSGSGEYVKDALVICRANPDKGFDFSRWVGSLSCKPFHVSFQIRSDIEATAYFINILAPAKLPCWDKERGLANPLVEMKIAPTSKWKTNYIGSTFGWTRTDRDGNRKHHSGIDLYAEPGTPLYAICDGVISKTDKYVTCQPMRIGSKLYPPGYEGDQDGAGNRFTLEGNINGETVKFSYWHLDAGKPVAINPRTGQPFRPGDRVYRGEVIAYSGRTGNAFDVHFPHLHLTVTKNGSRINPEDYLNGKITRSPDKRKISSTEITGIKCDEEDKELFADYAF